MWPLYPNQSLDTDISLNGENLSVKEQADQQGQWQVTDQQQSYIHKQHPNMFSPYPHQLPAYPIEEHNQYSSPNFKSSICDITDFGVSSTSYASQDDQELGYETQESTMATSLLYEYTNPHQSSPLKYSPLQKSPLKQSQWSYIHQEYPNLSSPYAYELPTYPEKEYNQYPSPNFQGSICDNTDFCTSSKSSASQDYQELDCETQEFAIAASLLYEYLTSLPSKSSPLKSSPLQQSPLKSTHLQPSPLKISQLKPFGTPKQNGEDLSEQEAEDANKQGQWQVTDQQQSYIHQQYPNMFFPYPHELPAYPVEEYNQYPSPNFQSSISNNTDFCASSTSSASQDYQELDFETQESAMAASLLYEYTNPHPLTSSPAKSSPFKSSSLQKSQLKISPLKPSGIPKPSQKPGDKKKIRIDFDSQQLLFLEQKYEEDKYLMKIGRTLEIAIQIKASIKQVQNWFRNRRQKEKKTYGTIELYDYLTASFSKSSHLKQTQLKISPLKPSRTPKSSQKPGNKKRIRRAFDSEQLLFLEQQYRHDKYLWRVRRIAIANHLQIPEGQVKFWFQNRRNKEKKKRDWL